MKMQKIAKITFFYLLFSFNLNAAQVIIIKFQNLSDNKIDSDFFAEKFPTIIEARLKKEKDIKISELPNIDKVLNEMNLSKNGLEPAQDIQIGKQVQAEYIITGNYKVIKDDIELNYRMTKIANGEIRFVGNLKGKAIKLLKSLESSSDMMAAEILGTRSAYLNLTSNPYFCDIYIDGNFIGESPIIEYPINPGVHRIEAMKDYYINYNNEIDFKHNENVNHEARLASLITFRGSMGGSLYSGLLNNEQLKLTKNFTGIQMMADFNIKKILIRSDITSWAMYRNHPLKIFNSTNFERRKYHNLVFSIETGYLLNILPRYLTLTPSISAGYRIISDKLLNPVDFVDESIPPYFIHTDLFQPGAHLYINIFPISIFGIYIKGSYFPSDPIKSYNGEFNQFGVKKFNAAYIQTETFILKAGFSIFIPSNMENTKPFPWSK